MANDKLFFELYENLNTYLHTDKPISQNDQYDKLKFVSELYEAESKNSSDIEEMQEIIAAYYRRVKERMDQDSDNVTEETLKKDLEYFDVSEVLRVMGEALKPILKQALGDGYKCIDIKAQENNSLTVEDQESYKQKRMNRLLEQKTEEEKKDDFVIDAEFLRGLREDKGKNFIQININAVLSVKSILRSLEKKNEDLFCQNIPLLQNQSGFMRTDLYNFYIMYKALCTVGSLRHFDKKKVVNGIDFDTFREGIFQICMQPDELAQRIFFKIDRNCEGYIRWSEFLYCMTVINAKTISDKINLFIKVADEDGNGELSYDEIICLTSICLSKFIHVDPEEDAEKAIFMEDISDYFAKLIFDTCEVDYDDEIPFERIRELILDKHENSNLLCMFCGADQ